MGHVLLDWTMAPSSPPAVFASIIAVWAVMMALLLLCAIADALIARRPPAAAAPPESPPPPEPVVPRLDDLPSEHARTLALARLTRFVLLAEDTERDPDRSRGEMVHWAIFSAYRDCVAAGLGDEARALLHEHPAHPAAPVPANPVI
jgi:hypothetical protein